jgi:ATP-dependent exoDNAse (exonuclease V) beta subunit
MPREMVLASAGTGKTFTIAGRIIGLLASGEAPGDVLATTFTRKAAGEILNRVLARLAERSGVGDGTPPRRGPLSRAGSGGSRELLGRDPLTTSS